MWATGGAAIVLAAVVLGVAALAERDRGSARPRRGGTVTAEELRDAHLPVAWRGYDRGHVDALLARAATTLEQVQRYGALEEPAGGQDDPPSDRTPGRPPSFLAEAVSDPAATEPAASEDPHQGEEPLQLGEEAELDRSPAPDEASGSGEELEDRGGDDAGRLDR